VNYYLYIVKCSDESLYTGVTRNIDRRIWQHNNSKRGAKSIRGKRPVKLVYKEEFSLFGDALRREKEIKGWSRKKKLDLINDIMR
jgi:putative endonuclease